MSIQPEEEKTTVNSMKVDIKDNLFNKFNKNNKIAWSKLIFLYFLTCLFKSQDFDFSIALIETVGVTMILKIFCHLTPISCMIITHIALIYNLFSIVPPRQMIDAQVWTGVSVTLLLKLAIYITLIPSAIGEAFAYTLLDSANYNSKAARVRKYKLAKLFHMAFNTVVVKLPIWFSGAPSFLLFLLEEFALFSAAPLLLSWTADFVRAGNNSYVELQTTKEVKNVVVFIHGNRFNECQYILGKELFEGAKHASKESFLHDSIVISVNYFGGKNMRDHTENTRTLEGCAELIVNQIKDQLDALNIEEQKVNFAFIGHSLGGVLSCFISENIAQKENWTIKKAIILSAPLDGSVGLNILSISSSALEDCFDKNPVFIDLKKDSEKMLNVRRKIKKNPEKYLFICGTMDVFVGTSSALPRSLPSEQKIEYPHLGHHNIKLSWLTWIEIINCLQRDLVKN